MHPRYSCGWNTTQATARANRWQCALNRSPTRGPSSCGKPGSVPEMHPEERTGDLGVIAPPAGDLLGGLGPCAGGKSRVDRLGQGQGTWDPPRDRGDRGEPGAAWLRCLLLRTRPGRRRPVRGRAARLIRGDSIQPQTTTHPMTGLRSAEASTGPLVPCAHVHGRSTRSPTRFPSPPCAETGKRPRRYMPAAGIPATAALFPWFPRERPIRLRNRPGGSAGRTPGPGSCDQSPGIEPSRRVTLAEA